jgi:hypothetical protein
MGHSKGNPKRNVYNHECIYLKQRKISNKQPNAASQTLRKTRTSKTQNKHKERNNKNKGQNQQDRDQKRKKETKSWFFENTNKIDKPLANLTKMRKKKTQISKIRNEKVEITTDTKEIQRITRDYFENLYLHKLENLEETDKFLDIKTIQN